MNFYRIRQVTIGSPEDRDYGIEAVKEEGFNVGDCVRCSKCYRPLSMLRWLPPYRIELESWGKHYGDIADIGDDLIVSDRFMQAFIGNGLSGVLGFEPVEVVKVIHRRGKPIGPLPQYFKAAVVRSQTTINQEASGFVWKDKSKVCSECLFDTLKRYQRLVVEGHTWGGEDVFYPRGGKGPLVSERFKVAVVEHGLQGVVFVPADSLEAGYDSFPWESEATGGGGLR